MKLQPILLVVIVLIVSCSRDDNPAKRRANRAAKARGEIVIGVVGPWDSHYHMLWQGIEMATQEINKDGGVLGRSIKLIKADDKESVNEGLVVAKNFSEHPDMVAVVGHANSFVSLSTSILYEYYGLLMFSPTPTSNKLTDNGLKRSFRIVPDSSEFARMLAGYSQEKGYTSMVIYNESLDYCKELANKFDSATDDFGITIQDRLTYEAASGVKNFKRDLKLWKKRFRFDAVFLAATLPGAAEFILEARKQGIRVPIISGNNIDSSYLLTMLPAEENVVIGTIFDPGENREAVQDFVVEFTNKYGDPPDALAALGYDSIRILTTAMERAETTIPDNVAEELRSKDGWSGIAGNFKFDERGDSDGVPIKMKKIQLGRFEMIDDE